MREQGISKPPEFPLLKDFSVWENWRRWFSLLTLAVPRIQTFDLVIDPGSCAANTTTAEAFTLTGIKTSDHVYVNKPTHTAGLAIANAFASATDQITIVFGNYTGSGIDPPSETYRVTAIRR